MSEREEDWLADTEGNLTPPGERPRRDPKPPTDEFGRDDPAAIERERRRREREARRKGQKPPKQKAPKTKKHGREREGGGLLGGLRRRREPRPEQAPPEQHPAETAERPMEAAERPRRRPTDGLRERLARRGGRGGGGAEDGAEPPRGGDFRRRRVLALVLGVLGLLLVWFLVALFQPFAGDGLGGERVSVDIPEGASAGQVADLLAEEGVVSNSTLFELRLKLSGKSGEIVSGPLPMAEGMSYSAAIDRLTGESTEEGTIVMPEGYSREQLAPIVSEAGVEGDYLTDSESFKGFDPAKYGAKKPPTLEGFLFPATYEQFKGETTDDLVGEQLDAFQSNLKGVDLSYAEKKNLTTYDVLIIASMVEREVLVDKERPLVAAVIYNRLAAGEPLGIDATTRYEYNEWEKAITQDQLDKDTPYNTRLNAGLPPTPIGNPGLASIEAAAKPAKVDYFFFVVKPGTCPAEHAFATTEAEFEKLEAQYSQARAEAGNQSPTC